MKVTRNAYKDMKIESKEWEENSEDVQKRSYEPKDDGRYEIVNKEERGTLIMLIPLFSGWYVAWYESNYVIISIYSGF